MKIIVAPDKFKGSLTSAQVCAVVKAGIYQVNKEHEVDTFPMADGGDGFAAVMQHYTQTTTVPCSTVDPLHRPMVASYQWNAIDKTAIIELAAASGLVLLQPQERNPMKTSSFGTGLLIKHAIGQGAKRIILGIGGSATNDAGTGILAALGFVFWDADNKNVLPLGENLLQIESIIPPAIIPDTLFDIACDVDNVLYGPAGAAFVYATQKGATSQQVQWLDDGLRHFAAVVGRQTNKDFSNDQGMGAAGGIAAGLLPFLHAELKKGTQIVIEASSIEHSLLDADLIITGEGSIDAQSKDGKLISSIAALGQKYHVPVRAFCGKLELDHAALEALGLDEAYAIADSSLPLQYSLQNAAELLRAATIRVLTDLLKKGNQ